MAQKELTYTQALHRLREIQELIESNRLDVDELSLALKESVALLKLCNDRLFVVSEETKKIIEEL
ncbi:MAG: exodeoxyribonuclease VII small subunit [Candidatus Symbiothrix sp.]|jgi:exonuclease VII small subunit|nr:exodeoxyribonuclease VII small subunit [Candidatus Symbiothrix sp.]